MLEWQKELLNECDFKKHCISQLTDAVAEVLIFKKVNEIITTSEFNHSVTSLLDFPKCVLRLLPDSHPIVKEYEMKELGGSYYSTVNFYHKLTGDKLLSSEWDKKYFCNMLKLKLGKHYDNHTK